MRFHLNNPLMERICELKERNYRDKDEYDTTRRRAMPTLWTHTTKYWKSPARLPAEVIAANAESVDAEGPHCANGRVEYASGTKQNLDAMVKAGLNGMTMPRRYGGLNFPILPTPCVRRSWLRPMPVSATSGRCRTVSKRCTNSATKTSTAVSSRICAGETMSVDLTEPDAAPTCDVMLKATYDEANQCWRLNGVKRFITNSDSGLHLVLAHPEEVHDGRSLSMFIYDKRDGGVDVRRIENKLGIHGSPARELVYKNAKAELCGDRKLGLIKYVMALMNGARLGIAAQSVGLGQAAYNEGLAYAKDLRQFGKAIGVEFPAVYDMLSTMKAKLGAGHPAAIPDFALC